MSKTSKKLIRFPSNKLNQHLRFNRINPTNPKHFQIKTRIGSIATIQFNSKINNPKLNIKINNNLKA